MKILVTGGAGYIGSVLVRRLSDLQEVEQVIVYDNLSRANYNFFFFGKITNAKVRFVKGDILDARTLQSEMEKADTVFHLAANVSTPFASQDPHFFEQVNHWGTSDVVYAVENSNVHRFIYLSSASVYGSSSKLIDENYPPNPKTFYGSSKLRGEHHVQRLLQQPGIKTYILRSGNVYGYSPTMRFDAVINRFTFEANFLGKITVEGTGHQHRSFIHVDRLVEYLAHFAAPGAIPPGTYNLTEHNYSVLEVAHTLKKLYPDLDMQFVNQHLNLREIKVDTELKLFEYIAPLKERALEEELGDFKERFAY